MNDRCPLRTAGSLAGAGCPSSVIEEILALTFGLGFHEAREVALDAVLASAGPTSGSSAC